jgi:hypothetical protein
MSSKQGGEVAVRSTRWGISTPPIRRHRYEQLIVALIVIFQSNVRDPKNKFYRNPRPPTPDAKDRGLKMESSANPRGVNSTKSSESHPVYADNNPPHFLEVSTSPTDEFCGVCKDVDIKHLFIQEGPYIWDEPINLPPARSLRHIKEHQQCPLCRLTLSAFHGFDLSSQPDREETTIDAVGVGVGRSQHQGPNVGKLKNELRVSDDDVSQPLTRLWFYGREGGRCKSFNQSSDEYEWEDGESFCIQLLPSSTVDSHSPFKTRCQTLLHARLVRQNIPAGLVKSWIQYCECHHPQEKGTANAEASETEDAKIRLLDVQNQQLVEATTASRYICLSYVWGDSNFLTLNRDNYDDLHTTQGLSKFKLPQTIADALHLCAQLGERWLWVDSLCIQQDDDNDRALQIQRMEMIYEKAVMTIANVSGTNTAADHPLPGVRPNTRQPFQEVHSIAGLKVVVSRQYPQQHARKRSKWATRAWTLQEEILSRRVLYIADTHCWFQCPTCYFSEDMIFEPIVGEHALPLKLTSIIQLFKSLFTCLNRAGSKERQEVKTQSVTVTVDSERPKTTAPTSLESLFELIEAYVMRHATLQSDALNAIDALLHRAGKLEHEFETAYHYGLPVRAFDYALCWLENEHDPTKRRAGFPSWSWAGWNHAITFRLGHPRFAAVGGYDTAKSLFTNAVLDPESQVFDHNLEANRSSDELAQAYGINVSPKSAMTAEHQGPDSLNPRKNDPTLLFYTSYAKLRVDSQPVESESGGGQPESCEVYTLRSPSNEQIDVSKIRLNRAWRSSEPEALELDFIVVRATPSKRFEPWYHTSTRPDPSSASPPNEWTVSLMCITWIDDNVVGEAPRRAERFTVCLREVHTVERWMSVEPKPVEVLVELV